MSTSRYARQQLFYDYKWRVRWCLNRLIGKRQVFE